MTVQGSRGKPVGNACREDIYRNWRSKTGPAWEISLSQQCSRANGGSCGQVDKEPRRQHLCIASFIQEITLRDRPCQLTRKNGRRRFVNQHRGLVNRHGMRSDRRTTGIPESPSVVSQMWAWRDVPRNARNFTPDVVLPTKLVPNEAKLTGTDRVTQRSCRERDKLKMASMISNYLSDRFHFSTCHAHHLSRSATMFLYRESKTMYLRCL